MLDAGCAVIIYTLSERLTFFLVHSENQINQWGGQKI